MATSAKEKELVHGRVIVKEMRIAIAVLTKLTTNQVQTGVIMTASVKDLELARGRWIVKQEFVKDFQHAQELLPQILKRNGAT